MRTCRLPLVFSAVLLVAVRAGGADEFGDFPVAKVERTAAGNLVLRHATWRVHLHPDDFPAFSGHVGRFVERSLEGYREDPADPPEPVLPGDVFSTPGVKLIQVLPDPRLRISVRLDRPRYTTAEPIQLELTLANPGAEDARIDTALSSDPRFKTRTRVVVHLKKIGTWDKPRFYDLKQSAEATITLAAGQSLRRTLDISEHVEGPGTYRVSAALAGEPAVVAPFEQFTVSPGEPGGAP
jgi:hypothetical protein